MCDSWEAELVSKCLNGEIGEKVFPIRNILSLRPMSSAAFLRRKGEMRVQCQQGPRRIVGASARGVPDPGSRQIWGARRVEARGRFLAGLGASEGCGRERVGMMSHTLPVR